MTAPILSHVFPNGLVLLAQPMHWLQSAAFSFLVPAGCVNEPAARLGLASLTCEMTLRGAGPRDNRQFVLDLDNLGVEHHASVSSARVSYGGATLAENLPAALAIFADVLQRPRLPAEELDACRQNLLQSLRAVEDEPSEKVMIELRRRHLSRSLGPLVVGRAGGPGDDRPGGDPRLLSAAIPAPGHDPRRGRPRGVGAARRSSSAGCSATGSRPTARRSKSIPAQGGYLHVPYDSAQTHIGIAYASVPYRHADYFQAWGAVGALGGGMSSRLFTEVRERRGLCYSVYASYHTLRDRAGVFCYAGSSAQRAQETLDVTLGELRRLAQGIEPGELKRLKARIKTELIMQQESSFSRSSSIAREWYHIDRARTLDELERIVDGLTCESINDYLAKNPPGQFTIVTVGPEELQVKMLETRVHATMQFLTHVLPNGLEIVAECNPEAYSTALGFIVKTGARDESDEIAGVSHFLEHMAFKGTPTRSADDVNRELDEIGSHCNAGTSEETTVYYAPVLPEYQTRATEVLADILRPSLREADFQTEKKVILEEIQMFEDQPPFGADEKCRAAFFGDHPLGRSVLGTMASIEALPVAAMRDYFRRRYAPGNIVLAAAGRVDFERTGRRLPAGLRRLGSGRVSARRSSRRSRGADSIGSRGPRPRSNISCKCRSVPRPTTTTAMRPRSWRSSWATIPAAGCTGNWSIRASPKWPN